MNLFDRAARDWDVRPDIVERNRVIAAAIEKRIPLTRDMMVLDYGAGTGLMSLFFAARVSKVVAADTSAGMLEVLGEKLRQGGIGNVETLSLDLAADPPPAAIFDLVSTSMTLHHVPDIDTVLAGFARITRPGGWIAVSDLVSEDGSFHGSRADVHHQGFDEGVLASKLEKLGFVDVKSSAVHVMRREHEGGSLEFPVFLMTARKAVTP